MQQAVDEWVRDGYARSMGSFGCSVLLVTADKCTGGFCGRPEEALARLQAKTGSGQSAGMGGTSHVPAMAGAAMAAPPVAMLAFREWVAANVPFARRIWRRLKATS